MSVISKFIFFTLCFSFLSWPTHASAAELEIEDTQSILRQLRGASGNGDFSTAFKCEQPLSFFVTTGRCQVHCEFGLCEQRCDWPQIVEAQFQAEDCSADKVSIYSSLGHSFEVTAADYQASSNSIALTIAKSISLFYDNIEKVSVSVANFPELRKVIEDGKMKNVMLTTIYLSLYPDRTKPESIGMVVSLDLQRSGLDQLMCIGSEDSCMKNQDYFIKRKGLISGQ